MNENALDSLTEGKYIFENGEVRPETNLLKWAIWYEEADRTVGFTKLNRWVTVSTIFLGVDHNHHFGRHNHVPILFETMVFGGENDGLCQRYATLEEAKAGHKKITAEVRRQEPWWWTRVWRYFFPKKVTN